MFKRIPLTIKLLVLTIGIGITIGGILDYFQSKKVKAIFYAQLAERLSREAQESRIHFDSYVISHNKAVKLIVSQKRFLDYIKRKTFLTERSAQVKYLKEVPLWLPPSSVLRSLINIRYVMLLDAKGKTREAYQDLPDAPPPSLLHPTEILIKLSHNQSLMTEIDGIPFLVTAESVFEHGKPIATLMLASPIDSEFLTDSQGHVLSKSIIALLKGEEPKIFATNRPDILPLGTSINSLKDRYIMVGKSFFDQGSSDLLLQFTSFISTSEIESLSKSVLSESRQRRVIVVSAFILSFAFIMFWLTRHIKQLTQNILNFSKNTLGIQIKEIQKGDELYILERQFKQFTEEIIDSRAKLITEAEELSKTTEKLNLEVIERRQAEEAIKEKETFLKNIFDSIQDGISVLDKDLNIISVNPIMEKWYAHQLPFVGKKCYETYYGKKAPCEICPSIRTMKSGRQDYELVPFTGTEGQRGWQDLFTFPLFDSKTGQITGVIEYVHDITERKKMEDQLKTSEQSYKEVAETLGDSLDKLKKREQTLIKGRDAFLNMLEDIGKAYKDLQELFTSLVSAMVNSLDAKSQWTRGHSDRVATYAVQIAKEMGFDEDEVKDLHLAGLLHDIGKIGTYDYLLDKPTKLTDEEFAIVKKHPAQGAEILKGIKQLKNVIPFVKHHHERIDGRGYPDGIKGDEIPLGARILHVADTFDAIMADRPYRPSPGIEYAKSELKKWSGTQFDPKVAEVFLSILSKT